MTMRVRILLGLIVVLATVCLPGCGHYTCGTTFGSSSCSSTGSGINQGGGGSGGATAFTYFVGSPGTALVSLDMAPPGKLTDISAFTVAPTLPVVSKSGGILVVKGKYLYMAFQNGTVYGFSINGTNGAVSAVTSALPYLITGGDSLAADPSGKFLFVGDYFGQRVYVFAVNTDGSLNVVTGSPFPTSGVGAGQMTTDGTGKYLYVADGSAASSVAAFSYDQTSGSLSPVPGSPFSLSNTMVQVMGENSGKYLIGMKGSVLTGSIDNNVYLFGITQTGASAGALTGPTTVATSFAPVNMTLSPNGAFLYTFNEDISQVAFPMEGFKLDTTAGTLTELGSSPFSNLKPQMGLFEQSGKYMIAVTSFVAVEGDAGTSPYTADSTNGGLTDAGLSLGAPLNSIFAVTDAP